MAQLQFKGKTFVQNHHLMVPYHQLVPVKGKSLTKKVSLHDNLIIHGDNLKALKALLPLYAGKVDCVYIDPPYNTGKENWAYNDDVSSPMMQEWLGKVVDREDLTRHDKWLCMMTPRLKLLKEVMRSDGVILVSIDDNEAHRCRCLMDEVFGENNFIAQLVWEKGRKNDAKLFSVGHEYMLVYAKSLSVLKELKTVWREAKPGAHELWYKYCELKKSHGDRFDQIEEALEEWFRSLPSKHSAKSLSRYHRVDEYGPWRDRDISWPGGGGPRYDVVHPVTKKPCKVPERGWGFATAKAMQEQIDLKLVVFRPDHSEPPFRKAHIKPTYQELAEDQDLEEESEDTCQGIGMQVMPSVLYKQSQVTSKFLRQFLGDLKFNNPKDHEILARIMRYVSMDKNTCFVLDAFAGLGSTAHAVLSLNEQDGGSRRFILIECEDYADTITAERVRRVIKGVPKAKEENLRKGLGGTFSYFELGKPIELQSILDGKDMPSYAELARYVFYTATGEEFVEKAVDVKKHFIGESRNYQVFLLYEADIEKLKNMALTLELAEKLPKLKEGKRRLVFAPTKYLDQERLDQYRIDFAQLPFEIYELTR